jgi:hypothetical protein
MLQMIYDMRRLLTDIELEAGVKHPEKPDVAAMAKAAERIGVLNDKIKVEIGKQNG